MEFEHNKANMIVKCLTVKFQDNILKKFESMTDWTIEDVDTFMDKELRNYLAQREAIMEYYNDRMANG